MTFFFSDVDRRERLFITAAPYFLNKKKKIKIKKAPEDKGNLIT